MATETPVAPPAPAAAPAAAPVIAPVAPPVKNVTPPIPAAQRVAPKPLEKPTAARARVPVEMDLAASLRKVSADVGLMGADGVAPAKPETAVVAAPAEAAAPVAAPVSAETKPVEAKPELKPVPDDFDPFADIKEPDGMSEKSKEGWKALKKESSTKLKDAQQKYNEAIAQLDNFRKATPAQQEDVAKLKAELLTAQDRLAVFDVTQTPEYARQFVEPKAKAITEAKTLLSDNGKDVPNMDALLLLPRAEFAKKVSEMAADMPAYDQSSFVNSLRQAYQIQGDSAQALTKAQELRQSLEQKRAATERQAFEETFSNYDEMVKPWTATDGADATERAAIESFNKERAELKAQAEKYAFGKMDPKGVAELAAKAASADLINKHAIPKMNREYAKLQQLNSELVAEITAIKAAKKPGSFTQTEAPSVDTGKPMSYSQIMAQAKAKSGQSRQ